ncbi:N-formylglutamate amidohydrolase [Maritalea mediterranea]|uniref:N-formylglutamate amidohydrolase n=1 Tax=Maritalea mediterranea TaxID=2909667 RepID=A0ABS9E6A0_9HYPH|nr:N-formylglutamate amidohydrolase [Maritalea mediterranea]MCF4098395.1 N-formylglutamate amidohydrolase [Maritalea mediterranea]
MALTDPAQRLLTDADPNPIDFFNPEGDADVLLVCEHAGQMVPEKLNGLNLADTDMDKHIGWDIGAAAVTKRMAKLLNAPALLQRYSRLVVDCNRPPEAPDAMPEIADNVPIPGNQNLSAIARQQRVDEIFWPFHHAVEDAIHSKRYRLVLSIHSFTPTLGEEPRPWPLAFLYRGDAATPTMLAKYVQQAQPDLAIGMNQPYQIDDESDWFVPHHGERNNIPHSLIEIRNDQISTENGQNLWAAQLALATTQYLDDLS